MDLVCRIVDPTYSGSVLTTTETPAIEGTGNINYFCGNCRVLLFKNIQSGQIEGAIVVKCADCGTLNTPPKYDA